MSTQNTNVGGWSAWSELTPESKEVFDVATHGIIGAKYAANYFSTQVVNGTNFCFIGTITPAYPNASLIVDKIYIYRPLNGEPHISSIEKIAP
jgi:hypothetical protein